MIMCVDEMNKITIINFLGLVFIKLMLITKRQKKRIICISMSINSSIGRLIKISICPFHHHDHQVSEGDKLTILLLRKYLNFCTIRKYFFTCAQTQKYLDPKFIECNQIMRR